MLNWTTSIYSLDDEAALARWRALWETSPQRSVFSSSAYALATAQAHRIECEMHLAEQDGEPAAGALVFWQKRGPYREVVIPPFTQYTPLVLNAQPSQADINQQRSALDALLTALEHRFHILRLFCPVLPDVRPAVWRGWNATPFYTYILDLQQDDPHAAWSSSTRRIFRKNKDAFQFEEAPEATAEVIRLAAGGYERHGRRLPTEKGHLLRLVERLSQSDLARTFTVTPQDASTPTGGLVVLHDGRIAHYWIAGSVPGPAMTVLLGELLPRLRDDGFQQLDFVGANTPSIAEFKRSFCSNLVPYFLLKKITRPELHLLRRLKGP